MVLCPSIFFLLIPVVFTICTNEVSSLGEKQLLSLTNFQWQKQSYAQTTFFSPQSRNQNGATILEMKHRDFSSSGPVSPRSRILEKRLIADEIRVKSIQSRIKNRAISSQQETQLPINSGIKLQTLNYIVTITLGNRNLTVIVDTGSDLTWIQCQPCRLCYTQPEPLFNPYTSPSYQSVLCSSKPCQTLQYATGNSGLCGNNNKNANVCDYAVTYGDGSYTRGELASDHLLLGSSTPVENFVFGCGRDNKGLFGAASGLIGLGRSDLSLISQTSDVFEGVFSYCLPDSDSAASGSLVLGNEISAYKNSTPISYTKLVTSPQLDSFYILNLTGTSVGGVALESKAGILIDSGTVITRLPPSIYTAVKSEFLKQFSGYPTAQSFSILDTCFNLSAYAEVNIPTLKMQFEGDGAEMTVDVSGMFYFVKRDASQACLALASLAYEDETGIIGNYQQRNTRVVYDTKQMKLGFAKEICSFS